MQSTVSGVKVFFHPTNLLSERFSSTHFYPWLKQSREAASDGGVLLQVLLKQYNVVHQVQLEKQIQKFKVLQMPKEWTEVYNNLR